MSVTRRDDNRPLPPDVLAGALQDRIHHDSGPARMARACRRPDEWTLADVDQTVEDIDVEDARRYPSRLRELADVIALTGAGIAVAVLILTGAVLRRLRGS